MLKLGIVCRGFDLLASLENRDFLCMGDKNTISFAFAIISSTPSLKNIAHIFNPLFCPNELLCTISDSIP